MLGAAALAKAASALPAAAVGSGVTQSMAYLIRRRAEPDWRGPVSTRPDFYEIPPDIPICRDDAAIKYMRDKTGFNPERVQNVTILYTSPDEGYIRPDCTMCQNAKDVLDRNNVDYTEVLLDDFMYIDSARLKFLGWATNSTTAPYLFSNCRYIGSYHEIEELERKGTIKTVLPTTQERETEGVVFNGDGKARSTERAVCSGNKRAMYGEDCISWKDKPVRKRDYIKDTLKQSFGIESD
jgi:glutaredoxin